MSLFGQSTAVQVETGVVQTRARHTICNDGSAGDQASMAKAVAAPFQPSAFHLDWGPQADQQWLVVTASLEMPVRLSPCSKDLVLVDMAARRSAADAPNCGISSACMVA